MQPSIKYGKKTIGGFFSLAPDVLSITGRGRDIQSAVFDGSRVCVCAITLVVIIYLIILRIVHIQRDEQGAYIDFRLL